MISDKLGGLLFGSGFAHRLVLGYRLDNLKVYPVKREGSRRGRADSGVIDGWTVGDDSIAEMEARWIPDRDDVNPSRTGWVGGIGWEGAIAWAGDGNLVRFVPDLTLPGIYVDCEMVSPDSEAPVLEGDATQSVLLKLRSTGQISPVLKGLLLELTAGDSLVNLGATYSRASVATYYDSNGIRRTAAAGVIRLEPVDVDLDGVRETGFWLLEPQRTNLFLQSHVLGNASWTKTNAGILSDRGLGADGTLVLDKIMENNATNGNHGVSQAVTIAAGSRVCVAADVRAAERTKFRLTAENGADILAADFDLTALTAATASSGAATFDSAFIQTLGNGLYRCHLIGRVNAASTAITGKLLMRDAAGAISYAGANDSVTGLWAGALQFEVGEYPTSYIDTTAAANTRSADSLSIPIGFKSPKVGDALTILVEFLPMSPRDLSLPAGNPGFWTMGGTGSFATDGKACLDCFRTGNSLRARFSHDSTLTLDLQQTLPTSGLLQSIVQLYPNGLTHELSLQAGAAAAVTDATPTMSPAGADWRSAVIVFPNRGNGVEPGLIRFRRLKVTSANKTRDQMIAL